jgi:N-acetylneuraminate synthase
VEFSLVRPIKTDAEVVHRFRSDPEVQKNSLTFTAPLSFEAFFPRFLATHFTIPSLPPLFIVENGVKVGLIRFNRAPGPDGVEISIVIAPEARGKGIGTRAIQEAADWVKSQGFSGIVAKIKPFNTASIRAFEAAGFVRTDSGDEELIFVRPLQAPESRGVFFIAEAGSNWKEADPFEMILRAKAAGADAIKFQVFRSESTYVKEAGKSGYLGQEVTELFKSLEMPYDLIPKLAKACEKEGIEFMATPFSLADFKAIDPYVKRHKIASYENNHVPLLRAAAKSQKPLYVSTGASTLQEVAWTVTFLRSLGVDALTLMQCTACYPAPPEAMHLETIGALKEAFKCPVGLSDHSLNPFAAPLAATALGASAIEKHFTLSRTLKGPDHAFAIEPDELKACIQEIRLIEKMRGDSFKHVAPCEEELRAFARRGLQAMQSIKKGEVFKEGENIAILRPGNCIRGAHPSRMSELEGKKALQDYQAGEGIFP